MFKHARPGSAVACLAAMWSCVSAHSWLHIVISVSDFEDQDQTHRHAGNMVATGTDWSSLLAFQGYKVTVVFGPQTTVKYLKLFWVVLPD